MRTLEDRILERFKPAERPSAYAGGSKLRTLLDLPDLKGKRVLDFGCGAGEETRELARLGAEAYGCDIRDLPTHRGAWFGRAEDLPVKMDYIISLDAFEHFGDPAAILETMASLLKPDGEVLLSFGPTWYHPLGGHLFSVFPWAHLAFSEEALIRWRAQYRSDGATRFSEVEGGLNQMTIKRFEKLVAASPLKIKNLTCVPIRKAKRFHNRFTREFLTAIVRCGLIADAPSQHDAAL